MSKRPPRNFTERVSRRAPICPCCGYRTRRWVAYGPGESVYDDFCADCQRAADAIRAGRSMPKIGERS